MIWTKGVPVYFGITENLNGRVHERVNEIKIRVGYLNMDYTDKIEELIEVDTWDFLLEAVCCAFNFDFENESQDTKIF